MAEHLLIMCAREGCAKHSSSSRWFAQDIAVPLLLVGGPADADTVCGPARVLGPDVAVLILVLRRTDPRARRLQGQRLQEKIGEICLQAGDVLLLDTGAHGLRGTWLCAWVKGLIHTMTV